MSVPCGLLCSGVCMHDPKTSRCLAGQGLSPSQAAAISCALQVLTWNSHTVDATIGETLALVREADEALALVKATAERAQKLAAQWSAALLFERKEGQVRFLCCPCSCPAPFLQCAQAASRIAVQLVVSNGTYGALICHHVLVDACVLVLSFDLPFAFAIRACSVAVPQRHYLGIGMLLPQVHDFADLQSTFRATFGARTGVIRAGGKEITQILGDLLRALQMGRASPAWVAYVDYIAGMVTAGLKDAARASLKYLSMLVRGTRHIGT